MLTFSMTHQYADKSVCYRRPKHCAEHAVRRKHHQHTQAGDTQYLGICPFMQSAKHRLQQIMKHQPQNPEAYYTTETDNSVQVKKKPSVIPQSEVEKINPYISDYIFHHSGYNGT